MTLQDLLDDTLVLRSIDTLTLCSIFNNLPEQCLV